MVDFLEEQVSSSEREELSNHLDRCPACAREFQELKRLLGILDEDEVILPTTEVFDKMKAGIRLQRTYSKPISRLRVILPKVLVPAFITAVLLLIFLWPRNGTVEFSIPVTDLIEDEDIAAIVLMGTIDKRMAKELAAVEDCFLPATEEAIDELTINEGEALIIALNRKYPSGT